MAETKQKKPNRIAKFFRDYKSELKKITWCPFKSVKSSTGVVIAVVVLLAIVIFVLDTACLKGFVGLAKIL